MTNTELAQHIIEEMRVLPRIDVDFEIQRRMAFIKQQLRNSGLKHLILGISGGIGFQRVDGTTMVFHGTIRG